MCVPIKHVGHMHSTVKIHSQLFPRSATIVSVRMSFKANKKTPDQIMLKC